MIIQIRGTSGSGKSTLMRRLMKVLSPSWLPIRKEGRKRPLYYRSALPNRNLFVLGHYDSPCGGCDSIGSARAVYDLIQDISVDSISNHHNTLKPATILCEGLLLSEDVKWSSQLPDLHVCYLTTPLATCLKQIEQRRKEAGNEKPLNVENTSNRVKVIDRSRTKLLKLGIDCKEGSVESLYQYIRTLVK